MEKFQSEALVDYSGVGKTVNDLLSRFSILQFLDLCSLIEGVVLYDRLVVIGGLSEHVEDRWNEGLKPLFDEGVLVRETGSSRPISLPNKPDRSRLDRETGYRLGYTIEDAWYETGRLIGAERVYRKPSLPLLRQKPYYERSAHVIEDHSVCDLFEKHQQLNNVLLRLREVTRLPRADYISVPIPPLPLMVLQRSRSAIDVLNGALEVRHEYGKLRLSLRDLRETLAASVVPPKEKLRAMESWVKAWGTLSKYEEQASFFELAKSANGMLDITAAVEDIGLDSLKWSKIIEKLLERFETKFYEWRIRQLHKSADYYLSLPETALAAEIRRVFGYRVTTSDIDVLQRAGIDFEEHPGQTQASRESKNRNA